jgi:hypothetical protein
VNRNLKNSSNLNADIYSTNSSFMPSRSRPTKHDPENITPVRGNSPVNPNGNGENDDYGLDDSMSISSAYLQSLKMRERPK